MKAVQLKALCKECGLKVSGKKSELQERLREYFLSQVAPTKQLDDDIDAMSDEDLRHAVTARGLPGVGTRQELLDRYRADLEFVEEMKAEAPSSDRDSYVALSQALEEAAKKGGAISDYLNEIKEKSRQVPKFMEVKVTSLGLAPEKYTAGGAPSVTSDVLRNLAGDPFSDPPKYGSVSFYALILLASHSSGVFLLILSFLSVILRHSSNSVKKDAKHCSVFVLLDRSIQ